MNDERSDQTQGLRPQPLTSQQARARRARWHQIVAQGQQIHRLVLGGQSPSVANPAASPLPGPARVRFTDAEVVRVPLTMTERAREALWRCHHEARQFPQALEEHFAVHSGVARIEVDCCPRREVGVAELTDPASLTPPEQVAPYTIVEPHPSGDPRERPTVRHLQGDHPDYPPHLHPDRAVVVVTIHHQQPRRSLEDHLGGRDPHYSDPPLPTDVYPPHTFYLALYTFHELHPVTHLPAMRAAATAAHLLALYPHPPLTETIPEHHDQEQE